MNLALQKDKELVKATDKSQDDLMIITNQEPKEAFTYYKKRWSLEVFFQSRCFGIKGRGFNMEKTHLTDLRFRSIGIKKAIYSCRFDFLLFLNYRSSYP